MILKEIVDLRNGELHKCLALKVTYFNHLIIYCSNYIRQHKQVFLRTELAYGFTLGLCGTNKAAFTRQERGRSRSEVELLA